MVEGSEQLNRCNEKQFRGGLVVKARRLLVSLNSRPRIIKKKTRFRVERGCTRPEQMLSEKSVRVTSRSAICVGARDYGLWSMV